MLIVTFNNEILENWLLESAPACKMSVDKMCLAILLGYMGTIVDAPSSAMKLSSNKQDIADQLIVFFQETYQERFGIPTEEAINRSLVQKIFDKYAAFAGDNQTVIEFLQKAMVWYLYAHKNEASNGGKFPYQLRILLEQGWLLTSCLESSKGLNNSAIKQLSHGPVDVKAIKRGDYPDTFIGPSAANERARACGLVLRLQKEHNLPDDFLEHPSVCELFWSKVPTMEYIRKAEKFLEKCVA